MSPSTGISIVLGLLTFVSLVASAVAVARASLAKSTIETLQESNSALTERVTLLKDESGLQENRIKVLEAENKLLKNLVSGTEAIERLTAVIAKNTHEWHRDHEQQATTLVALHDLMIEQMKHTTELLKRTA